mmetsp:Transcript_29380/g.53888  ORF Transcript_29380/g.53888 Transcript_29380/m.53888 type:complete len:112 (-) Transcript_29380:1535-1870(-)
MSKTYSSVKEVLRSGILEQRALSRHRRASTGSSCSSTHNIPSTSVLLPSPSSSSSSSTDDTRLSHDGSDHHHLNHDIDNAATIIIERVRLSSTSRRNEPIRNDDGGFTTSP